MLQGLLQHGCFLYQAQKESLSLQGGKGFSRKSFHLIKLGRPIILCSLINPKLTDLGPEAYLHLCHILVARSKSPLLLTTRGRGPHNAKDTKQQESWKLPQGLPTCPRLQISSVHLRNFSVSLGKKIWWHWVHIPIWQEPAEMDCSQPPLASTCLPECLLFCIPCLCLFSLLV